MFSKKKLLASAIMLYMDEIIDEEEAIMVFDDLTRRNPPYPYWKHSHIEKQLDDISEAEFVSEFRFHLSEVKLLQQALRIPDKFICVNGTVASGVEGLLLFLKRFAYPCRLSDLIPRFGRSVPEMSLILSEVTSHIAGSFGHLLQSLNQPWLQPLNLERYAESIHRKGAALDNCWGFVDGTLRAIARPGENQRIMYNGHKRIHGIKFQSVVTPDGMIANLYGPVEGRKHDASMLRMSGLLDQLCDYSFNTRGETLCIYGDPAYPLRVNLMAPYRSINATQEQQNFNQSMSSVRVGVEWVFGDITNFFTFLDFKRNLKIGLSPVGTMYSACAILRNAYTCLYSSNTSTFFDVAPPKIQEYFQF